MNFIKKLKKGLTKTREQFIDRVGSVLSGQVKIDDTIIDDIEDVLIQTDMGVDIATRMIDSIRTRVQKEGRDDPNHIIPFLKDEISLVFQRGADEEAVPLTSNRAKPYIIMMVGVNGTGKTTTIGKLAYRFKQEGKTVLLSAADTFRAAAIEQLDVWAKRAGADIVHHQMGADPASVVFDSMTAAEARGIDVLIIDTAGRLQTKVNLMEEVKKIKRVLGKKYPEAPHEILLVLDATTGQNGISQAQKFHEALDLTGIVLTKLDGTAKGGIVIAIHDQLDIPVKMIGIGEGIDDLRDFHADEFVEALFAE